jgi:hypothetical protein
MYLNKNALIFCIMLSLFHIANSQNHSKIGGICFRADDNQPISYWLDFARIFDRYGYKFTFALNLGLINDQNYVDLIKQFQANGHELADHTPNHDTRFFTTSKPQSFVNNPGVDHISGNKVCLKYGLIDTLRSYIWEDRAKISGNLLISENPGQFNGLGNYFYIRDLETNAFIMAVFISYFNKPFMIKKIYAQNQSDPDTCELASFWDEPVNLGSFGYINIQFLSQYDIQMSYDALELLFQRTRDLCQIYGIDLPQTFIQPGGLFPQLIPDKSVTVLKRYYSAAALYPNPAIKVFNEFDPYKDKKFRLRSGDFEERVQELSVVKGIIADAVAKHRVLITTKHFVTYVLPGQLNWNDYLRRLDSLLNWCKQKGINVKTYGEWAKILYETPQNPYVNVFPALDVDLDENGFPDGYYIKPGYTDGIYDTTDGVRESGFTSYKINKIGTICFVNALGGLEKGENDFLIYTKGEPGDSIDIVFTTPGELSFLGSLKFPADTREWKRYRGTIAIPFDVSLVNIRIRCSNYSSGWVKVSGMTLRKKIDKPLFIISVPDTLVISGQKYEYVIDYFADNYTDSIRYDLSTTAEWLNLVGNKLVGVAPEISDTTIYFIKIVITDEHGNSDSTKFNLYVVPQKRTDTNSLSVPIRYYLGPAYPNPFNSTVTIPFSIGSREKVQIKVYDILGREVTTLIDGEMLAGDYKVNWNAVNVSSGIYICRMRAGKFSASVKLMLIK